MPNLQTHSRAMGQKGGEKWTAAVDLQPTISKSDRLLDRTPRKPQMADPMLGLDLVVGTTSAALHSLSLRQDLGDTYPQEITFHILVGLGMTKSAARKLVNKPIEAVQLPPDSLLVRTLNKPLAAA